MTAATSDMAVISKENLWFLTSRVIAAGYNHEIEWSQTCVAPESADDFALEAAFVICNSGMKNTVARPIYERVRARLLEGGLAGEAFGHRGKCDGIDAIWAARFRLYEAYMALETDDQRLAFLAGLPWIGGITKYHLAKNFGVDVAKPDVHLQRLADREGVTVQQMCDRLARETGFKARTVDLILWRACAGGMLDSRTGVFTGPG
jgi:hypothetical protein